MKYGIYFYQVDRLKKRYIDVEVQKIVFMFEIGGLKEINFVFLAVQNGRMLSDPAKLC